MIDSLFFHDSQVVLAKLLDVFELQLPASAHIPVQFLSFEEDIVQSVATLTKS